jgi:FkbM family methyltransferase
VTGRAERPGRGRRTMLDPLRTAFGVARSLAIYHGRPWRFAVMDAFYARFVRPGDLCFDLGAHVGNRVRSWRKLGARVVAVEPQPALARTLRLLWGRDAQVRIVEAAVAAREGRLPLHLNLPNPTISTSSSAFIAWATVAPSFRGQAWERRIEVPAVTLDGLIAGHGEPRFVKIDVEGYEAEALAGLSRPLPALSVEFVPMARAVAEAAVARLAALGPYRFNASLGDEMRLLHPAPLDASEVVRWLRTLGDDGPAGDLYACLDPRPLHGA